MSSEARSQSRIIRPSPNEEAAFIEKRLKEKRRTRLLEVRQQEKDFARQVRQNVQRKKQTEVEILEQHLKECAEKRHKIELARLEEEVRKHYLSVGQGQRDAAEIGQEEKRLLELRLFLKSQQRTMAKKRQLVAMKELPCVNPKSPSDRVASTRAQALAQEREQAKKMSSSKITKQSPTLIMELEPGLCGYLSTKRVRGVEYFASTYFHLPDNLVDRETVVDVAEPDANQTALQINLEEENRHQHLSALHEEQKEKARLRHKHALAKLKLEKDKDTILKDLSLLVREDRTHRQRVLQQIPNNVFQPVQDRLQQQQEEQRQLEHAFEKLLTGQENIKSPVSKTIGVSTHSSIPESNNPSVPDSAHPVPLSPPPLPAPLIIDTPQSSQNTISSKHVTQPCIEKNPSVIVPCGVAEESDLSIQTLSPSFESHTNSEPVLSDHTHSSSNTAQTSNTGYSGDSTSDTHTTETSESTGISRLIGLIRSQQQTWQQHRQQLRQGSPELRLDKDPPLSLSISTVTNSTDQCESDTKVSSSKCDNPKLNPFTDSTSAIKGVSPEYRNDEAALRSSLGNSRTEQCFTDENNVGISVAPGRINNGMNTEPASLARNIGTQQLQTGHVNSSMGQYSPYTFPPYYYYSPNWNHTGWDIPQHPWVQYPPMLPTSIQGSHPSIHPSIQGSHPSIQGSHPSVHPSIQGSHPSIQGSHPSIQGSHPSIHPSIQGSHPSIQGSHPSIQGSHPSIQGSHPSIQGSHVTNTLPSNVMMCVDPETRIVTPQLSASEQLNDPSLEIVSIVTSDPNNTASDRSCNIAVGTDGLEHSSDSSTLASDISVKNIEVSSSSNESIDTPFRNTLRQEDVNNNEVESLQRREFIQNLLSSLKADTSPLSERMIATSSNNDTPRGSVSPNRNETPRWSVSPNRNDIPRRSVSPNRNETPRQSVSPNRNETPRRSKSPNRNETPISGDSDSNNMQTTSQPPITEPPNTSLKSTTTPEHIDTIMSTSSDDTSYYELDRRTTPINQNIMHSHIEDTNSGSNDNRLTRTLSLQEAFLQRNRQFAKRSRRRVSDIEMRAKERQSCSSTQQRQVSHSSKREAVSSSSQQRHVSFSCPLIKTLKQMNSLEGKVPTAGPPARLFSKHREKITSREMQHRNLRLYSQLPEVKRKQSEIKQQEELMKNREKAKNFHENLRLKMKGKKVSKS